MDGVIKIGDKRYPKLLKDLGNRAPKQLYYRGEWKKELFENCLAVVGSRRMTTCGRQAVEKIVTEIASRGITIVSGFMYGIDASAHKAAVEAGGKTIAVMPCGIDLVHPEGQTKLYNEILESKGLIISEYEGNMQPGYWNYPQRNRIVAGLSSAVLVVEAAEKSGSLITAGLAKKYNRKLFAVPGSIVSLVSKGTNQLIKEGAEVATSAEDVLKYFGIKTVEKLACQSFFKENPTLEKSSLEMQIFRQLETEPMDVNNLCQVINVPASKIGTALSLMQLNGLVFEENGKYHIKEV